MGWLGSPKPEVGELLLEGRGVFSGQVSWSMTRAVASVMCVCFPAASSLGGALTPHICPGFGCTLDVWPEQVRWEKKERSRHQSGVCLWPLWPPPPLHPVRREPLTPEHPLMSTLGSGLAVPEGQRCGGPGKPSGRRQQSGDWRLRRPPHL